MGTPEKATPIPIMEHKEIPKKNSSRGGEQPIGVHSERAGRGMRRSTVQLSVLQLGVLGAKWVTGGRAALPTLYSPKKTIHIYYCYSSHFTKENMLKLKNPEG